MADLFPNIDALEAYVDQYIIANGNNEITGPQANNSLNGCIEFIRKSPLNYAKAAVYNQVGTVTADTAISVITGTTPTALIFNDNIYHEYVFINMTAGAIPLGASLGYYNLNGVFVDEIPANSAVNIVKASNDLWVLASGGSGGGGGSTQKQPLNYTVGVTPGAPGDDTAVWTNPAFNKSYVVLWVNQGLMNLSDAGDGNPYITKPLNSSTLTITGRKFFNGDVLQYILITP